jgi:PAS domain S-box-containing protein
VSIQPDDIVFASDPHGRLVFWNKEAESITGRASEEVLGKPYTLACGMKLSEVDLAAVMAGRDYAGGARCRGRSGAEVALYLYATCGRSGTGDPAGVVFVARDVTDLWRIEEAARVSADKYRLLFEHSLDSVAIADLDGRVLEANPACLRLYGYTAGEIKRMSLVDIVAPEDRDLAAKAMSALAQGNRVQLRALRVLRKDGTELVVELAAYVAALGGERRVFSVTRDVTERSRADAALRESEQRYRAIFESASDAVFVETIDGRILDVNRHACDLLGYQRNELVKMSVTDLVPPDARAWLPHLVDTLLRDGAFRGEAVNVHKDGRQIPVEIGLSRTDLGAGAVVLAIVRDVTERKRAEQALRESEEKFRSVSEQSPNMIFINSRGRVVYVNRQCEQVTGYSREEFYAPGFDFMQLIAPESVEKIKSVYARHARGEEVEPYEYALVTKGGRRIEGIITTKLIVYDGSKAILGIVTDITERVRASRALEAEKERSQTYLALAGVMLVALDKTGRITLLNRKGCEVLGVPETEALGRSWFDNYVPERNRAEVKRTFASLMNGELQGVEYYENPILTAGGRERLVAWHNVTLRDDQGRPTGTISSGEDVTERVTITKRLQETEEQYRRLVEMSPDGIVVHQDGRVVLVNPAGARMLGYGRPEEVIGQPVLDFVHPDDVAGVRQRIQRVLQEGKPGGVVQERFRRKDGSYGGVEVLSAPFYWRGQRAVQVVLRDVAERNRAERALRESEENYRSVVERASDGICVVQDGKLSYLNNRLAEMAGYTPAELVGEQFLEYLHPDDRAKVADAYRRRLAGEEVPSSYTVRFLRRSGGVVTVEVNAAVATYGGAPAEIVLVRDVTERERLTRAAQETADGLRAVLDNSPEAIVGECDGVLVYANQRFARLLGYDAPAEIIGRPAGDFDAPQDRALLAEYSRLRERGQDAPAGYSFHGLKRDGTVVPLEATTSTYRSLGRLHILAFVREFRPGGTRR